MDELRAEGVSIRDLAAQFNISEPALKIRFRSHKPTKDVPRLPHKFEDKTPILLAAYQKIINDAKKRYLLKNKDASLPKSQSDLIKELFNKNNAPKSTLEEKTPSNRLHRAVTDHINKSFDTSMRTVQRSYGVLKSKMMLPQIWGETIELKLERALKGMKDQDEYQNAFTSTKAKKWVKKSRTLAIGEHKANRVKRGLKRLYEVISFRYGEWENLDGLDISDSVQLAKAYEAARLGKRPAPHCENPKPIPFKDWNDDLIEWALDYINWNQRVGTYPMRTSLNHLIRFNKSLSASLTPVEVPKETVGSSSYTATFGTPDDLLHFARAAQTQDLKITPDLLQVKGMINRIKEVKIRGDIFKAGAPKIGGGTVKLSKKIKKSLERESILLAIHIACATGMRVGTGSKPHSGIRSVRFQDIHKDSLHAFTKTSKSDKKRKIEPSDLSVLDRIRTFETKLRHLGIDTENPKVYVINVTPRLLNIRLRDAAKHTGVAKYETGYGEYKKITAAAKGKKVPVLFKTGDPRIGNSDYEIELRSLKGHLLTEDPDTPDIHMHLFRAFALRQLVDNDVPFVFAVDMGSGWDDISTAKKYYMGKLTPKQLAMFRKRVEKTFEIFK